MSRHARWDAPGTIPPVIIRGIERREIVADAEDRRELVAVGFARNQIFSHC